MPSRLMHEFLVHLIETCDVDVQQETIPMGGFTSGFQQLYMGSFPPRVTLRRHVRFQELEHLPMELYREFTELLQSLMRSGHPIDVSRKYRGVRLVHMDTMMNPESFGYDFRLEFTCDSIEGEYELTETQRERMQREHELRSVRLQEMMQQPRRSAMLPPDWFEEEKPKKVVKKKEEHFDKDLFEV